MAITATTSVLTGDDWKLAKDIRPGDWVFNQLGKPVRVKTAQMYRSEECYRVMFDDYLSVDGDMHLAFAAENIVKRGRELKYQGVKKAYQPNLPVLKVTEMLDKGLYSHRGRVEFSVPTTQPIELPTQPLDIPPFVYGTWYLGRIRRKEISVPTEIAEQIFEKFKENGYKVVDITPYQGNNQKFRTEPCIWRQLAGKMPIKIPLAYLNGDKEQRLELIRGLLCARMRKKPGKRGQMRVKTHRKATIMSIQYLSESLGAKTRYEIDKSRNTHDLTIFRFIPFLEHHTQEKPSRHFARRYVKSIKPIPAQLCVHIETDDSSGSYLAGEGFIPCH